MYVNENAIYTEHVKCNFITARLARAIIYKCVFDRLVDRSIR